jgi:2-hydroxy-3-oxopropionate reductase
MDRHHGGHFPDIAPGRNSMKIGFIGLGIMGAPMALNLKKAGHDLVVPERKSLTSEIRGAAEVVADSKSVAAKSEVLILMVPDTPDVEAVLFGPNGAAEGLKRGTLVIDMSSISPLETKAFAKKINERGCDYLDAPVSGGEVGAKQATLTIMVGGPEAAFARAKPLFDVLGKNITHVGNENGAGQTCKVANQIIVALNIQACAEALIFAARAGADPAKVRTALMGGFASSRILEVHAERMLNGTFNPGFRIRLHQKDLNLALTAAKELGLSLPNTAIAQQMFSSCAAHGGADLDHSALILAVEGLADFSVREKK